MTLPRTDPETLLARHVVVSLAVQALIERLLLSGVLTPSDLVRLREFGLQLADQLRESGMSEAEIGGDRLEFEIRAWWDPMGVPANMSRPANDR